MTDEFEKLLKQRKNKSTDKKINELLEQAKNNTNEFNAEIIKRLVYQYFFVRDIVLRELKHSSQGYKTPIGLFILPSINEKTNAPDMAAMHLLENLDRNTWPFLNHAIHFNYEHRDQIYEDPIVFYLDEQFKPAYFKKTFFEKLGFEFEAKQYYLEVTYADKESGENLIKKIIDDDLDGITLDNDFVKETIRKYRKLLQREETIKEFKNRSLRNAKLIVLQAGKNMLEHYDTEQEPPLKITIPYIHSYISIMDVIDKEEQERLHNFKNACSCDIYTVYIPYATDDKVVYLPVIMDQLRDILNEIGVEYIIDQNKNIITLRAESYNKTFRKFYSHDSVGMWK